MQTLNQITNDLNNFENDIRKSNSRLDDILISLRGEQAAAIEKGEIEREPHLGILYEIDGKTTRIGGLMGKQADLINEISKILFSPETNSKSN